MLIHHNVLVNALQYILRKKNVFFMCSPHNESFLQCCERSQFLSVLKNPSRLLTFAMRRLSCRKAKYIFIPHLENREEATRFEMMEYFVLYLRQFGCIMVAICLVR